MPEVDQSLPYSVEVKNEWSSSSSPPYVSSQLGQGEILVILDATELV